MQLYDDRLVNPSADDARYTAPMEWWFVQGSFDGERTGRREFMLAFFRHTHKLSDASATGTNAFCLLLSVLDPACGRTRLLSQVDPATCEFLVQAHDRMPAGFDPLVTRAVADELADCGPPRPIRCEASPVEWTAAPFRLAWNGMVMERNEDAFVLRFSEPETGRRCEFQLTPSHPGIHISDIAVVGTESMDYVSYTRLTLAGDMDGEPVHGQAWLDHQWGSNGWLAAGQERSRILGWDWLGIQLDDGHDLLVMVHRDLGDGSVLCRYAVLVTATGPSRLMRDFELSQTAWWTSPATHTRYPVACRLTVPELNLDLQFTPATPAQEIPMLAPLRAVWEGAGHVAGTWAGRAVAGRARLELHGYAYILNLREHLDGLVKRIGRHVETYLPRNISVEAMEQYAGPASGQYDPVLKRACSPRRSGTCWTGEANAGGRSSFS